ncbi:MAG: hypothetical protein JNM27_13765 [Leptospirales bacterium]|nr:hypothetical protein [Leptospirales bacterium]
MKKIRLNQIIEFLNVLGWSKGKTQNKLTEFLVNDKIVGETSILVPNSEAFPDYEEFTDSVVTSLSDLYKVHPLFIRYNLQFTSASMKRDDLLTKLRLTFIYLRKYTVRFGDINLIVSDLGATDTNTHSCEYLAAIVAPDGQEHLAGRLINIDKGVFNIFGYKKHTYAYEQGIQMAKEELRHIVMARIIRDNPTYYDSPEYEQFLDTEPENLLTLATLLAERPRIKSFIERNSRSASLKKFIKPIRKVKTDQYT